MLVHLCFCETRWSLSVHDLSMNFTTDKLSVQRKETASRLRRHRSERTRSYWKCFNCFSLHLANVDSNMSGTNHWLMTRFVSPSNICKRTYSCYYINTHINNVVYCTVFIVLCWSICVSARHAGEVFRNCRWTLGLLETSCQCSAHRISAICCSLEWVSEWVSEQFLNGTSAHNRPFQCHYMVLRLKTKYI